MIKVTSTIDRVIGEMLASIDRGASSGMDAVDKAVADEAASVHTYQSRTGDLEASTQAGTVKGSFLRKNLRGEIVAGTPYAAAVEEGRDGKFAFLKPAFERKEDEAASILERHMADE